VRRYQYVTDAFSTRNPTVVYTVLRDEAGLLECNCPAWTFSTKIVATAYGPQRVCNHVLRAIAGALPGAGPFRPAAEVAHGPAPRQGCVCQACGGARGVLRRADLDVAAREAPARPVTERSAAVKRAPRRAIEIEED
jgi:hypothetical protein